MNNKRSKRPAQNIPHHPQYKHAIHNTPFIPDTPAPALPRLRSGYITSSQPKRQPQARQIWVYESTGEYKVIINQQECRNLII